MPNENTERQILYIAGASGSGKTYFTGQYLKAYKEMLSGSSTLPLDWSGQ